MSRSAEAFVPSDDADNEASNVEQIKTNPNRYAQGLMKDLKSALEDLRTSRSLKALDENKRMRLIHAISSRDASLVKFCGQDIIDEVIQMLEEIRAIEEGLPEEERYVLYKPMMKDPINELIEALKE